MRYIIGLVLVLGACGTVPTQAQVFRFEGPAFRACTVALGWTVSELVARCGRPDAVVRNLNGGPDERCLIYRTDAQTFAQGEGVPVIAACTSTEGIDTPFAVESTGDGVRKIVAVYGLRSVPAESLE